MTTLACLSGRSPVVLWGLSATTRMERLLAALGDVHRVDDLHGVDPDARVLLLRADYLFEVRTLSALLKRPGTLLVHDQDVAAACVPGRDAEAALAVLEGRSGMDDAGVAFQRVGAGALEAFEGVLRKAEPPLALPVTQGRRSALESQLYGVAYKGITDLVTKFWWPRPAKHVVRWCADHGVTPNLVTFIGFVLMLAAAYFFLEGQYLAGLLAGWIMTFLDTVDGKLARVTVQSSRVGHIFDHGMDIVHPPFWYLLWGMSLAGGELLGLSLGIYYALIFGGYVAGRLVEGAFHALGSASMFAWRPFDAYFRLITARRNPCLILLTLGWAFARPDLGFIAVALWTAGTSAVLIVRLGYATAVRTTQGPLESWLADPVRAQREHPRAYATFSGTRRAYFSTRSSG